MVSCFLPAISSLRSWTNNASSCFGLCVLLADRLVGVVSLGFHGFRGLELVHPNSYFKLFGGAGGTCVFFLLGQLFSFSFFLLGQPRPEQKKTRPWPAPAASRAKKKTRPWPALFLFLLFARPAASRAKKKRRPECFFFARPATSRTKKKRTPEGRPTRPPARK